MTPEVLQALTEALARGEPVGLVTIVSAKGSTPQRVGAKMLVHADGRTVGTIGGGCYEHDALGKARDALRTRKSQLVRYDLTDDFAADTGLICGGRMEVFIEAIEPPPHLYIVGAGHVGWHLGQLAPHIGFRVHVIDDRAKFANAERFPAADEIVVDAIPEWLEQAAIAPAAYVVILTRGHRQDYEAVRALANRQFRYVGLIGSRAKVAQLVERALAEGIPAEWLRAVHAPVGLDIGAVTPEEIAVSILGELIAVRRGKLDDPASAPLALRWTSPLLRETTAG